jgi:GPH family glycoside/pentoside/hexuronide:cation symporter
MPSPPETGSVRSEAPSAALTAASGRVPTLHRLGYGVGNVAFSLPYQAVASLLVFFTTAILKIPPAAAGVAIALTIVWDAAIDPLLGYLSDNTEGGRWGRRHPYLLVGGLLVAVLTVALWSIPPGSSAAYRFWAVFLLVTLAKTALSVYSIPYLALGGELSRDYDERAAIQGYRAAFYLVGMIAAIAGATLIFFRSTPEFPRGQLNPAVYPKMGIAFAVAVLVTAAVCFVTTWRYIPRLPRRTEEMRRRKTSVANLIADFVGALRNRDLRMLVLMIFVIEAGFQFGIAIGFHTNTFTYGMAGPMIGLLTLIVLGTSVLSQPLWVAFTRRYEKKTALTVGLLVGMVGFVGAPWTHVWWKLFPVEGPSLAVSLGIFMVFAGLGNGAFMSIPNAMVADAADVEELRTGKRDEGLYFGMYSFAYSAGVSISTLASGFALEAIGFDPHAKVQSASTRFNLAMVPTYLLLATAPFALLFIARYAIDRKRWREIQTALAAKRRTG